MFWHEVRKVLLIKGYYYFPAAVDANHFGKLFVFVLRKLWQVKAWEGIIIQLDEGSSQNMFSGLKEYDREGGKGFMRDSW